RSAAAVAGSLTILTDAPGSTPPEESLTTPAMTPVFCAKTSGDAHGMMRAATSNERNERNMTPPEVERARAAPVSSNTSTDNRVDSVDNDLGRKGRASSAPRGGGLQGGAVE